MDTGLNYAVNRYYNSSVGRFTSQDPSYLAIGDNDKFRQLAKQELQQLLSDPQQLNSYAYARNNPLVNIDPDGNISIRAGLELAGQGLNLAGQYVAYQAKQEWQDYQDFRQASYQWQTEHPKTTELLVNVGAVLGGSIKNVGKEAIAPQGKTFQTYQKVNPETGEVYIGRTSGIKTPEANVKTRDNIHHMNKEGYAPAQILNSSSNPDAIRGQEQRLIENQRAQGNSGNKINGISPNNPSLSRYLDAAKRIFGIGK